MEAYIKPTGTAIVRWLWFVGEEGLTDEDFDNLYVSQVDAYGFALTRRGAQRKARKALELDGPLEIVPE